jgi:uncharacterized protein YutE (UPF0331/DUF86 family)
MADLKKRVEAEFENIDRVVAELPDANLLSDLSGLEVAGVAALIHNFYNGAENVLKQILTARGQQLPEGSSWHRDMVNIAVAEGILSESTASELRRYLAFRHFFSHGYSFDIDENRLIPLVKGIRQTLADFKTDISRSL